MSLVRDALRQAQDRPFDKLRANGGNKVKLYGPFGLSLSKPEEPTLRQRPFDSLRANRGD
ncbi:hypothetical protein GCM10019060_06280 [Novosphingobium pokkalii]|nr:hypothetical protein GCM10019060_06280 [Novosphingobium pokkalii]